MFEYLGHSWWFGKTRRCGLVGGCVIVGFEVSKTCVITSGLSLCPEVVGQDVHSQLSLPLTQETLSLLNKKSN